MTPHDTGNEFLNVLAGCEAVFSGSEAIFDPAKNPPVELAAGKVRVLIKQYLQLS